MGPKKKAAKAAAAAPAGGAAGPGTGGAEASTVATFTPAEAKKLAKLLKASDRGKRLDAIGVVSENHRYIASGGCLLPLLESVVAKKKMEEVVLAASQVRNNVTAMSSRRFALCLFSRLLRLERVTRRKRYKQSCIDYCVQCLR